MKVAILGAGAWGTGLAIAACRSTQGTAQTGAQNRVSLWARDMALAQALAQARCNQRYLPGVSFPASLNVLGNHPTSLQELAAQQDLLVIATPVAGLRPLLLALKDCRVPLAWLCKGFERPLGGAQATLGLLPHEVHAQIAAQFSSRAGAGSFIATATTGTGTGTDTGTGMVIESAVLSGPSFAAEVARGQPSALVAASKSAALRQLLVDVFHGPSLRIYASDDVVGVEVGGAVKNVLAIATGLCDGLALGLNARAALITRGLAEMTRLGLALGARTDTFMGLSGLGDLVLTATGDLSRNRKVGLLLAQGKNAQEAVDSLGHVAEGVYCARTVVQRARQLGVDMPIAESVVSLLNGEISPQQAVGQLMTREPKAEA